MKRKAAPLLAILVLIILTIFMVGCRNSESLKNSESSKKVITKLEDAANARIGMMVGSSAEVYIKQKFPSASIMNFTNIMDAVAAVKAGQLDAAVLLQTGAVNIMKTNSDLWYLPEPLNEEYMAIATRKDDGKLLAQVDSILSEFKKDGTLEDMQRRWTKTDTSPYETVDIQLPKTGEVLKVGVSANREPFSFLDAQQRQSGHDGELSYRIAAKLGRPIEFYDTNFNALLPALQSGRVDLVISGMTVTEERKKFVNFSQTYFTNPMVMLVKKGTPPSGSLSFLQGVGDGFYNNIIKENRYLLILDGLKTTVSISVLSAIFGTLLGGLICFLRMSRKRVLRQTAKIYISLLRGMPVLVLLMLIYYVVFASVDISPILVAVLAFGMNFAAYVSEVFRTGIESIDRGQTEAGVAMGFSRVKAFLFIVLPQALRRILPVYKGEFISMVKMTSIVGYIAVQDLTKASDIIRSRTFDAFFPLVMVAILYFLISGALILILKDIGDGSSRLKKRQKGQVFIKQAERKAI